jgi:hypothetical protein
MMEMGSVALLKHLRPLLPRQALVVPGVAMGAAPDDSEITISP